MARRNTMAVSCSERGSTNVRMSKWKNTFEKVLDLFACLPCVVSIANIAGSTAFGGCGKSFMLDAHAAIDWNCSTGKKLTITSPALGNC